MGVLKALHSLSVLVIQVSRSGFQPSALPIPQLAGHSETTKIVAEKACLSLAAAAPRKQHLLGYFRPGVKQCYNNKDEAGR
jgi:hypothetical protein